LCRSRRTLSLSAPCLINFTPHFVCTRVACVRDVLLCVLFAKAKNESEEELKRWRGAVEGGRTQLSVVLSHRVMHVIVCYGYRNPNKYCHDGRMQTSRSETPRQVGGAFQ